MEINKYLTYLDELTHVERSVFFYRLVFNLTNEETAHRLKVSNKKVKRIFKMLQEQKELLIIKDSLMEQYQI